MTEWSPIAWILLGALVFCACDLLVAAFGAFSLLQEGFHWLRSKHEGTTIIDVPDQLEGYILSGTLTKDLELVVGINDEWEGDRLKRVAITSHQLPYPEGTILRIIPSHRIIW